MPRYFFDIDDGERQIRDDTGLDLACLADVERESRNLLHDLAYAEILNGAPRAFTAWVRNADGTLVYQGTMTLEIDR